MSAVSGARRPWDFREKFGSSVSSELRVSRRSSAQLGRPRSSIEPVDKYYAVANELLPTIDLLWS
eukprot:15081304-Alexandrium_andersonii.AAC.1